MRFLSNKMPIYYAAHRDLSHIIIWPIGYAAYHMRHKKSWMITHLTYNDNRNVNHYCKTRLFEQYKT